MMRNKKAGLIPNITKGFQAARVALYHPCRYTRLLLKQKLYISI
ncbi:hypothetical protein FHT78_005199 [Rhizobium sp. BK196]|nr:hypothetical protein [Rhizobium sp. BK196]